MKDANLIAAGAASVTIPNPGSDEALALGCQCPVLDNGHGRRGGVWTDGGFWISAICELHNPDAPQAQAPKDLKPEPEPTP